MKDKLISEIMIIQRKIINILDEIPDEKVKELYIIYKKHLEEILKEIGELIK